MGQQFRTMEKQITKTLRLDYLLYLPPGYSGMKSFPLILFLHGSGERGDDLEKVKRYGIPKILGQRDDFPFIVVSPQCPAESDWGVLMDHLVALLEDVMGNLAVDPARVYLTGLSMGGRGAYQLAFVMPQRFAALVPISAARPDVLRRSNRVPVLKHIPVWIFHGAQDDRVPVTESEEMERDLRECGGSVRLTIYPDAGHDAWTRTYENPDLYAWMLEHRRSG